MRAVDPKDLPGYTAEEANEWKHRNEYEGEPVNTNTYVTLAGKAIWTEQRNYKYGVYTIVTMEWAGCKTREQVKMWGFPIDDIPRGLLVMHGGKLAMRQMKDQETGEWMPADGPERAIEATMRMAVSATDDDPVIRSLMCGGGCKDRLVVRLDWGYKVGGAKLGWCEYMCGRTNVYENATGIVYNVIIEQECCCVMVVTSARCCCIMS